MHHTLLWTLIVALQRPLDTSHTRTMIRPPHAPPPPSQALMHRTLLWILSMALQRPLDTSHTRTDPSHPAVAACVPSGLKQTLQIASVWPCTHRT